MDAPLPPARAPRRWWRRHLLALTVVFALVGGLLWSGWYVYNRGFTRKWRELLAAELRRRGFDFSARRLTLNPFEGLIAENVRVYTLDADHTQLLYVDRVAVDIDLIAFVRKRPFLNSLDLRGARLTLPIEVAAGPDTSRKLKLRRLSAKVAFLPDELRLTQAEGEFYGLQLSASGSLLHPENFSPPAGPVAEPEAARRRQWMRQVIDELDRLTPERAPPRLEIRFQGDLARPGSLRASAQLEGEALRRGAVRVERLLARLDYTAGAFHLQQGEITDRHGTLSAQGDFNPDTAEAHFQVQSGLDLFAFAREFYDPHLLTDLRLRESPRLQLEGHARFNVAARTPPPAPGGVRTAANDPAPPVSTTPLQLTGRLALGRFAYHEFEFTGAETDFSWNRDRWYLRGLRVTRPGSGREPQALTADVLAEPAGCRVRLTSTLDPVPFAGLLPPAGQEALLKAEFHEPPRVELSAAGPSLTSPAGLRAEGKVTLGRTRYRNVGLNGLRTDLAYADGLLTARHIALERDEGTAAGDEVVYDFAKHEMRLDNLRCNLDVSQAGAWLDPDVYHTILPFRFRRPPALVMNGNLQFAGGRNSHFVTTVNAPGGMDYVFAKKTLPFQSIAGQVVFNEERLALNDLHANILGGQAHGTLNLALGKGSTHEYTATMELKDLDFARLTKLYFDYDGSKGLLSGNYRFTGRGNDPRTLRGAGSVLVDHGNVFAIPFLGPLSPVVGTVLPGLGFDEAHQASANFLTDNGKIYLGDLDIKGRGLSLFGRGWLGYTNDTMNFRVSMNTRGLPGTMLWPVSKLLEYSSQGPLSKPVWRPQVLSKAPPLATPTPVLAPQPK